MPADLKRGQARFLDDPQTRLAAESDPVGFLDFVGLMLIDEVQRVPGLWLAIKNSGVAATTCPSSPDRRATAGLAC